MGAGRSSLCSRSDGSSTIARARTRPDDFREAAPRRRGRGRFASIRDRLEVVGASILYAVVPLFPRESLVAVARALGRWGFLVLRAERRVALANLDLAYGDSLTPRAKRAIARRSFENFVQVALDIFWARRFDAATLARVVETPPGHPQLLRDVVARGRGMIAIVGHIGSWEMLNTFTAADKIPVTPVVHRFRNSHLNALVNENRRALGDADVIYHDQAARGILKALRAHRAVAIALDQNTRPDRGGTYVPFFGRPVAASRAPALFAMRTGAPVLFAVCFPLRGGRYRIEYREVVEPPAEGGEAVEKELTARFVAFLEGCIRERPDAWLWAYRRWKYRPDQDAGGSPFYSKWLPERTEPGEARVA